MATLTQQRIEKLIGLAQNEGKFTKEVVSAIQGLQQTGAGAQEAAIADIVRMIKGDSVNLDGISTSAATTQSLGDSADISRVIQKIRDEIAAQEKKLELGEIDSFDSSFKLRLDELASQFESGGQTTELNASLIALYNELRPGNAPAESFSDIVPPGFTPEILDPASVVTPAPEKQPLRVTTVEEVLGLTEETELSHHEKITKRIEELHSMADDIVKKEDMKVDEARARIQALIAKMPTREEMLTLTPPPNDLGPNTSDKIKEKFRLEENKRRRDERKHRRPPPEGFIRGGFMNIFTRKQDDS